MDLRLKQHYFNSLERTLIGDHSEAFEVIDDYLQPHSI
jgi:hypothetical protein